MADFTLVRRARGENIPLARAEAKNVREEKLVTTTRLLYRQGTTT